MANYKRDKIGRQGKAYRDKLRRDSLKNIEEPELKPADSEDKKKLLEMWEKMKNKN